MSKTPKAVQNLLDELEASRQSRKRAWEILQEIRWVLKDTSGIEVQQPPRKTMWSDWLDLAVRPEDDSIGTPSRRVRAPRVIIAESSSRKTVP